MDILSRIKAAFQILANKRVMPLTWLNYPQGFSGTSSRSYKYIDYATEGFKQNPVVFSCISEIERSCKNIKLVLMRNGEDVDEPDKLSTPILEVLKRPNPYQSMPEWIAAWSINMQIAGISYIHPVGIGTQRFGDMEMIKQAPQLWLLRPDQVEIHHTAREITKFTFTPGGSASAIEYAPDEIIYTRYPDPLDLFAGQAPMQPASIVIDGHNKALSWWDALLKNMGKLSGVLGLKGMQNVSPDELKRYKAEWQAEYSGPKNAGKTLILPGDGFDYTDLGKSPTELDWAGSEGLLTRRICICFGVPSQLLGDPDTSKYSNYKEARKSLYMEKSIPDMELLIGEMNVGILPRWGPEWSIRLDYSHIDALREDENAKYERVSKATWMDFNEKRAAFGLDERKGGDVILVPFNSVTLESISESQLSDRSTRSMPADDEVGPNINKLSRYPTEAERRAVFQKHDKDRLIREKKYQKKYNGYLEGQRDRLLKALEKEMRSIESRDVPSNFVKLLFDRLDEDELLTEAITGVQIETVVVFGQASIDELKLKGVIFDIKRPAVQRFIAKDLPLRSKLINKTTARELQNIINKGVDKGEGVIKIRNRIVEKYDNMSVGRARTIAQTETGHASGMAKLEGYKQTDLELIMEWVTARDADVRDEHQYMDGETTPLGESFSTPSGPTEQVPPNTGDPAFDINCRCVMVALKPGEKKI